METQRIQGHGVGLRPKHYQQFLESCPEVSWVEAISENFMGLGGRPLAVLQKVRRDRPVALHGVSLGIGSVEPLDARYLRDLSQLVDAIEPALVSDHLCWGRHGGRYIHDLLPLPFTEASVTHVVERVDAVQNALKRRLLLENVSSYLTYKASTLTEWEFLAEVARRADCEILLDVNNIYVSARNHQFDPLRYLDAMPKERVRQIHLAGHQDRGAIVIDTHEGHIVDAVWSLYRAAVERLGAVPTLIEWDEGVPELAVLLAESRKAARLEAEVLGSVPVPPARTRDSERSWRGVSVSPVAIGALQASMFEALVGERPLESLDDAVNGGALYPAERLDIYAQMYQLRAADALRADLPHTTAILGDALEDSVHAYLASVGSTHYSLARLGHRFADFLRLNAAQLPRPDLASLARLEWARSESFIAPDEASVGLDAVRRLPVEQLPRARFRLAATVRLLSLEHDVLPLWQALQAGAELPTPAPLTSQSHVLVWRRRHAVVHAALDVEEARALEEASRGGDFSQVCDAFAGSERPEERAFKALASWLHEGLVAALDP